MSPRYRYLKINNYFICLNQNPIVLALILYFKVNDLNAIFTPWKENKCSYSVLCSMQRLYELIRSNIKTLIIFFLYRLNIRHTESCIELPVYGHVCKHVHKGHKVFNLINGTVIKLYDSDVSTVSIEKEIERLEAVSHIAFAPALTKWNINERWYEETYISGRPSLHSKPVNSEALLTSFNKEIIPCLKEIMFFKKPSLVKCSEYTDEIFNALNVNLLLLQNSGSNDIQMVRQFLSLMSERLTAEGNSHIYLVNSHGDFCPANILDTSEGIKVIDWESMSMRSALFDFYSYFFYRPACIGVPLDDLFVELDSALPDFVRAISKEKSPLLGSIESSVNLYRRLYYIERICMLVERESTDRNLQIMDFILRYIKAFSSYEEILSNTGQVLPQHPT